VVGAFDLNWRSSVIPRAVVDILYGNTMQRLKHRRAKAKTSAPFHFPNQPDHLIELEKSVARFEFSLLLLITEQLV
jgi:hypothetical protein